MGESNTLLEGRANAFTVDSETKIQNQIDRLRDSLSRAEQGRELKVNNAVELMDEKVAFLTERFDQRFQTNE